MSSLKRKRGTPLAHFTCSHEPGNCIESGGRCSLHTTPKGKLKILCLTTQEDATVNTISSHKKVKYHCDVCLHEVEGSCSKITKGFWCGMCKGPGWKHCNEEDCEHCFQRSFASYDDVTENDKRKVDCLVNPEDAKRVLNSSTEKVNFQCDVCHHTFESTLNSVVRGSWCYMCSISWKHCDKPNCEYCFQRSFASYDGVTENGKRKVDCLVYPEDAKFAKYCHAKVKFQCDVCLHEIKTMVSSVARGGWCYMCSTSWKHCDKQDCDYCFQRTFASYEGVTVNGKRKVDCLVNPEDAKRARSSNSEVKFQCDVCLHEIKPILSAVTQGGWCYMCSISWKHCAKPNCEYCFQRSFASYEGVTENGKRKVDCLVNPEDAKRARGSGAHSSAGKAKFQCDICLNEFDMRLKHVYGEDKWCPHCKNKTELKVFNFLSKVLCIETEREYVPVVMKNVYKLRKRFDFLLVKYNIIFEIDGRQHNKRAWFDKNEHTLFRRQLIDKWKEFVARRGGKRVIRFDQHSIWTDSYDWRRHMKDVIVFWCKEDNN